jgi:hypothetical protein
MTAGRKDSERLQFLEGGLLTARDLRDDVAYESRMRGLHVRVLHNIWGVARGFEVHFNYARDTVLVGPGLAYDCVGREIISSRSLALAAPRSPEHDDSEDGRRWFDLVIGYDDRVPGRSSLDAGCLDDGASRSEERPRWRWTYAGMTHGDVPPPGLAENVRLGEEIPLTRAGLDAQGRIQTLDFRYRRHAQGLVRPHIGSGNLPQGSVYVFGGLFSFAVQVDTRSAGFSQTPYYFASLEDQWLDELEAAIGSSSQETGLLRTLLGPFLSIESPRPTDFLLRVRFGIRRTQIGHEVLFSTIGTMGELFQRRFVRAVPLPVGVNWVGIEPVEGCQPEILLEHVSWLSGQAFFDPVNSFRNLLLHGAAYSIHGWDGQP